jgi:hypothetical protein
MAHRAIAHNLQITQPGDTAMKLPSDLEETNTFERMPIGATGYTVPWAMFADASGELYLNSKYTFDAEPGGTMQLQVLHTPQGFIVDVSRCRDYRWNKSNPSYVGTFTPLPVMKIIR